MGSGNLSSILDAFSAGIMLVDGKLNVHAWNGWLARTTGVDRSSILGKKLYELFPELPVQALKQKLAAAISRKEPVQYCPNKGYLLKIPAMETQSGLFEYMQQLVVVSPLKDDPDRVLITIYDHTSVREAEKKLLLFKELQQQNVALVTDANTGLLNRAKLIDDISEANYSAVAILNIQGFHRINTFYGFDTGDRVIRHVAKIISQWAVRDAEKAITAYKLPSDEYALLWSETLDHARLERDLEDFSNYVEASPYRDRENEIDISVTIGATFSGRMAMRKADTALNHAKANGKRWSIYDESMDTSKIIAENILWLKKLKHALKEDNIVCFFQPIINNATGQVEKYESLVRMIEPETGKIISPYFFLDVAKRARVYPQLTKIIAEKAFRTFQGSNKEFSINLSVEDILNSDSVTFILDLLKRHPELSRRCLFEIVESEGIENFEEVSAFIGQVKQLGCKVAIDDFGTGYSNFHYMIRLDVDYLKIDGSLIKNIVEDSSARVVVETIVEFARKLGIKTVAEFVHDRQTQDIVCSLGVDYSQGFYLGKPSQTPDN